jgi:DNA-binding winged helix-turn-helix (wHTH) protein
VLSLESLSQFLWGSSGRQERRRLSVMIFRLREKLQRSNPYQIHTIRRRGYGLLVGKQQPD